jgi:hypothetical protein
MSRKRIPSGIEIRRAERRDGSVRETFCVRYAEHGGIRRRRTFDSLEDAGVGVHSVVKTLSMLQRVFGDAVEYGDVAFNPFKAVKKPAKGPSRELNVRRRRCRSSNWRPTSAPAAMGCRLCWCG